MRNKNLWRGIPEIEYVSHGEWSDPELIYDGLSFNYWDVEDALWNDFLKETGYSYDDTDNLKVDNEFTEYCKENAVNYLNDAIAGGYFGDCYEVVIGTGTAFPETITVYADGEIEALDKAVDELEDEGSAFALDYYDIYDLCDDGETVDEYVEANNLTCAGNASLFVDLIDIRKVN